MADAPLYRLARGCRVDPVRRKRPEERPAQGGPDPSPTASGCAACREDGGAGFEGIGQPHGFCITLAAGRLRQPAASVEVRGRACRGVGGIVQGRGFPRGAQVCFHGGEDSSKRHGTTPPQGQQRLAKPCRHVGRIRQRPFAPARPRRRQPLRHHVPKSLAWRCRCGRRRASDGLVGRQVNEALGDGGRLHGWTWRNWTSWRRPG
ncbi:MAG: hypothetical protein RL153_554 [Verrucomicrobiota bacterium]